MGTTSSKTKGSVEEKTSLVSQKEAWQSKQEEEPLCIEKQNKKFKSNSVVPLRF